MCQRTGRHPSYGSGVGLSAFPGASSEPGRRPTVVEPAPPAAPAAETSDAAASANGQPASSAEQPESQAQTDTSNIDAWIRDRAFGQQARLTLNPDGVVPTAELEQAASGESAPEGDVSPGDVPTEATGDAGSPQPQPGRRAGKAAQAAATIESLQAELATLKGSIPEQVAEATRAADEAKAEAARLRAQQTEADQQALDLIGAPEEYARLLEVLDGEISEEDWQKRERWKANRQVFSPVQQRLAAEEANRARAWINSTGQQWAAQALAVANEIGLDPAELSKPENADIGRLMKLAASVTEARVRSEYAERVSQVERDRDTARGEAISGRRSPVTNGAASGAAANSFEIDHWIRQRAGFA